MARRSKKVKMMQLLEQIAKNYDDKLIYNQVASRYTLNQYVVSQTKMIEYNQDLWTVRCNIIIKMKINLMKDAVMQTKRKR